MILTNICDQTVYLEVLTTFCTYVITGSESLGKIQQKAGSPKMYLSHHRQMSKRMKLMKTLLKDHTLQLYQLMKILLKDLRRHPKNV